MRYVRRFAMFESSALLDEQGSYLSKDENSSIKSMYKFIRDVLLDMKRQISLHYQKNPGKLSISEFVRRDYRPVDKVSVSTLPCTLVVDLDKVDPLIKKTFKSLQRDFYIRLEPQSDDAGIKSKIQPLRIEGMVVGTTKLLNFPEDALKSSLQHELQHIANLEKEEAQPGYENGGYDYLASRREVDSHAKQFAYLYHKRYPGESLDIKKLRDLDMAHKSKDKLNLFLWFMAPDQFRGLHQGMSDETYRKIKRAGIDFPQKVKYYVGLFNKKT